MDERFDEDLRNEPDRDDARDESIAESLEKADRNIQLSDELKERADAADRLSEEEHRFYDREPDRQQSVSEDRVLYQGCLITPDGLHNIRESLNDIGVRLDGKEQENMHMTAEFFGKDADKTSLIPNEDLGRTIEIRATAYGEYRDENGRVLNQGLEIDKNSLKDIKLSDGRSLLDATKNEIPHITLSICQDRDEEGKPAARAVDTWKCDFDRPLGENGKGIDIKVNLSVFTTDREVAYNVEREDVRETDTKNEEKGMEKEAERQLDRNLERMEITEGAYRVIDILQKDGHNADLVGGCVRDAMLGLKPKDEDITTNLEPDRVTDLFEREGFKVIPTGIEHGTVTIMVPDKDGILEGYEVTTYRIDGASADQRHPDSVSFTDDIREDMSRRDFTINAMAFDPRAEGEDRIKDFYNGREDIENKVIRTVGNPEDRIKEDALRMMRAVRFAAQKDFVVDDKLKDAIKDHSKDIEKVSKERINAELTKILESDNPARGLSDLRELGLMKHIAPALDREYDTQQNNPWHLYDVGRHTERVVENTPNDKITRCAALFHDLGKTETRTTDERGIDHFRDHPEKSEEMTRDMMKDLKFTSREIKDVCQLVKTHDERLEPDRENICRFIERHQEMSLENIDRLIDLQRADMKGQNPEKTGDVDERYEQVREIFNEIKSGPCRMSDLALNGRDIQGTQTDVRGDTVVLYGKDIQVAKEKMFGYVLREPDKNNPADLRDYLRDNLKTIKNISINRLDGKQLDEERVAYAQRAALNKIEREIRNMDKDELDRELGSLNDRGEKGENLERLESLYERREALLELLRDSHSTKAPRLSDEELKADKRDEEARLQAERYEKAVEEYCSRAGMSRSDYTTHEFYADRGMRDHLPPESIKGGRK